MASSYPSLPRVLSIAGTDPSGGAGTAADTKSITVAGGYSMTAVTAVVAQNTVGVRDIHFPPATSLAAQLNAVSDDVVIDAVKTGMLGSVETIQTVTRWIQTQSPRVLVVDPVMIATSGDRLLDSAAEEAMVAFCQNATVVTPNIDELARLTGQSRANDQHTALDQARRWAAETGSSVVVKTGHLNERQVTNTWVFPDGELVHVPSHRIDTTSTHGTGCSLSAALATRLAAGDTPGEALGWSTAWLHEAIAHGEELQVGNGHGPVDHGHRSRRLQAAGMATPWLPASAVPEKLEAGNDLVASVGEDASVQPASPIAAVAPVGPWTRALWKAGRSITDEISRCSFVRQLVDGSLDKYAFAFYLTQDALYLNQYARALAALATASTNYSAQVFWAQCSVNILTDEAELHRNWLSSDHVEATPGPVTNAYTDFLLAATLGRDRVVGAAAVLPCLWLYAQTGASLPTVRSDHPYAAWLETYQGEGFIADTQAALQQVEQEFEAATPQARAEAARVYLTACRHELEFFNQALRIPTAAPAPRLVSA
ncbi:MAG: bifunctional hydroxymethylpyrimidine kinase/phosphomethylpyrimidine kinase [Micrococcaceae bacterium]|nr:bifunctional hydroxymethylpyrimidine kinase/phosphomethylpyrimidine kinase [Micrococcaceae bacterium]